MSHEVYRQFREPTGREWQISELPEAGLRALAPDGAPVTLLFVSGAEHRTVSGAPAHWWDLPSAELLHWLAQATPEPPG